jgi:hypothetical protein
MATTVPKVCIFGRGCLGKKTPSPNAKNTQSMSNNGQLGVQFVVIGIIAAPKGNIISMRHGFIGHSRLIYILVRLKWSFGGASKPCTTCSCRSRPFL